MKPHEVTRKPATIFHADVQRTLVGHNGRILRMFQGSQLKIGLRRGTLLPGP